VGVFDHEQYPFNTDNRAWCRLPTALGEHLDLVTWQRDGDGRPILVSLVDLGSGDIVTLAVLDSQEMREPHTLLAFTVDGDLAGHGHSTASPQRHPSPHSWPCSTPTSPPPHDPAAPPG